MAVNDGVHSTHFQINLTLPLFSRIKFLFFPRMRLLFSIRYRGEEAEIYGPSVKLDMLPKDKQPAGMIPLDLDEGA